MDKTLGIIRHSLSFIGGILVTEGYITDQQSNLLVGALTTIIAVVWSIIDKNKAKQ